MLCKEFKISCEEIYFAFINFASAMEINRILILIND
jgi:hypothetical protein